MGAIRAHCYYFLLNLSTPHTHPLYYTYHLLGQASDRWLTVKV